MISALYSDFREKEFFQARCHYTKATVDGVMFNLFDDAYIQASEGEPDFIAKIVEMFETVNKETYVCTQWFYRAKDTVLNILFTQWSFGDKHFHVVTKILLDHYTDNENSSLSAGVFHGNYSDVTKPPREAPQSKRTILDLYSGCGAMSSGLSIGASLAGENFNTRWAVDFNYYACESLKSNHPNTEVRNEDAEDFFLLLREWENLCKEFNLVGSKEVELEQHDMESDDSEIDDGPVVPSGEFEVEKLVAICYGDPNNLKKHGLHFKVRWKGYGRADDTWEPVDGLRYTLLLFSPGDVDFICGGPPCQGISGFNRFRHADPLKDKKNRQLVVFMNIVEFLKPRYVLMENVTDILKFAKGQLACYAVGRLVSMNYQARLGIMAAGAYGVPQCRMRFFLWGAGQTEEIIIGHGNEHSELHKTVLLGDVISDMPEGANFRNLPGVMVGPDNVVKLDPSVERPLCKSGKPLVPDYAITFEDGKSSKPFGRLGMDDIVATVVTRAQPHNQVILHPDQDRVLSARENARLQGFPDCYKLFGPIKERYMQVGNAVSFSVSIPLGYCLAKAVQGANNATPLSIPFKFPDCLGQLKSVRQELEESIA
ncbi:hypothetical protein DH2020_016772 [Rehmannia glutinosa]|uniref:DNA (cytosine-5-)-methyltransferase n=1 Tax=Rehmannia glutinosa TaxID=99300 RepID=A0ABR0WSD5_REHGL